MAIAFLTGQRLTADLLNENIYAYMPVTYSKAAAEPRNTTTTLANDGELAGIALGVGTWDIELLGYYTVASTTPRLKTRWALTTGTWTSSIRACTGPGNIAAPAGGPEAMQEMTTRGYSLDTQDAVYNSTTSSAYSTFRETARQVVVSVAGTLSLQWAQNTSNASNVTIQPGTCFTIRKISA